jgi:hypothetical protein
LYLIKCRLEGSTWSESSTPSKINHASFARKICRLFITPLPQGQRRWRLQPIQSRWMSGKLGLTVAACLLCLYS